MAKEKPQKKSERLAMTTQRKSERLAKVSHASKLEEKPSRREIIDALATIMKGVDLSTHVAGPDLWYSILKDLGDHFGIDLTDRPYVRTLIAMATSKRWGEIWQGFIVDVVFISLFLHLFCCL